MLSVNKKYIVLDLLRNNYNGRSPPTYGESYENENGKLMPAETVLTSVVDLNTNHCLDYFLQFIPNNEKCVLNSEVNNISVDEKTIRVEKFLIDGKTFTQLSDHYGISGNVKVMAKKDDSICRLEISK